MREDRRGQGGGRAIGLPLGRARALPHHPTPPPRPARRPNGIYCTSRHRAGVSAPWIERLRVLLGAHRPKRVAELIGQRGCELHYQLHYLPSYSPDLNPIEEAFAKIKNLLGRAAARSMEALLEAIGATPSAVSAQDARGFFEHAGYCHTGQPL